MALSKEAQKAINSIPDTHRLVRYIDRFDSGGPVVIVTVEKSISEEEAERRRENIDKAFREVLISQAKRLAKSTE